MNIRCDDANETAPRWGCACRGCYVVRQRSLDPRLVAVFNEPSMRVRGPSRQIVRQQVEHYLCGQLEWALLHVKIIESLVTAGEDVFDKLLLTVSRSPSPGSMFFGVPGKGETTDG